MILPPLIVEAVILVACFLIPSYPYKRRKVMSWKKRLEKDPVRAVLRNLDKT